MSTHHIPPVDKKTMILDGVRQKILESLRPFIKGRSGSEKEKNLKEATSSVMRAIKPALNIPSTSKGVTVMTEGASMRNPHTKSFTKRPENI